MAVTKNERLKRAIRVSFDSQMEFAAEVEEHESFVSMVVNGWKQIDEDRQKKWATALGCKAVEIF
jgi:hypothetical protein